MALDLKYDFAYTQLTNTKGILMDVSGKSDSANFYFTKALELGKKHNFKILQIRSINNLGMYNWNRGEFKKAQDYFFKALEMNDAYGDEQSSAKYLNNIGLIYQEMNIVDKALEYHLKSYEIRKKHNLLKEEVASLNNIGICLKDLARYDEAMTKYEEGLKKGLESGNLIDYYRILENIASLQDELGNLDLAIEYYKRALQKRDNMPKDEKGDLIILGKLAGIYNRLGKPVDALKYINKSEEVLVKYPHYLNYADDLLVNAAESYYRLNNNDKGRDYILRFVKLKDSIFSQENANAIADFEVKYETEKKEKQILVHRAELAEKELVIQQRNYQFFGLLGVVALFGLLGYMLFNQQKLKNKQLQKESELKEALVKIETQNELQEQRLRISRDLHDNIGAQLTFIISSLDNLKYGFDIKNQDLTSKLSGISSFTRDTIYELRDTIWAMNKNEISFEDLQTRISNFIEKADIASKHIKFEFAFDKDVNSSMTFTSINGMNIYRIIQEAINNAIKYADATKISVYIHKKENAIEIEVIDDGKGFDIKNIELGNGINNMKKRADEIEAKFSILSKENKGTTIKIAV